MSDGGAYSSFVRLAKIILPVTALCLLGILFLFARAPGRGGDIPYAQVEDIARQEQLLAPRISGVTPGGDQITVEAAQIAPDDGGGRAAQIKITIEPAKGGKLVLNAGSGQLGPAGQTMRLSGLARVDSSAGFRMETESLTANILTGAVETDGNLEIRAPFGQLSAGKLTVTPTDADKGQQLLFQDGVRLLYIPQHNSGEP